MFSVTSSFSFSFFSQIWAPHNVGIIKMRLLQDSADNQQRRTSENLFSYK